LKNLVNFKLFESNIFSDDFISDIKDISLEFVDNEIEVNFGFVDYYNTDSLGHQSSSFIKTFAIDIKDISNRFFRWEDIKDTILRIDYVSKQSGFNIDIEVVSDEDYLPLDDFISIYSGEELYDISILIYKK
jgi:hypothetical protein